MITPELNPNISNIDEYCQIRVLDIELSSYETFYFIEIFVSLLSSSFRYLPIGIIRASNPLHNNGMKYVVCNPNKKTKIYVKISLFPLKIKI
jgi:hypothetical protein